MTRIDRSTPQSDFSDVIADSDVLVHLAGENRPTSEEAFMEINYGVTDTICEILRRHPKQRKVLFSSTTQVVKENNYGKSKVAAEDRLKKFVALDQKNADVKCYRLPGVFGKWCKPNYNSVVATFCHNIANGFEISVDDENRDINLVYIDDLIDGFLKEIRSDIKGGFAYSAVDPIYRVSLGDLANKIKEFKDSRKNQIVPGVGKGFDRALHAIFELPLPIELSLCAYSKRRFARNICRDVED